MVGMASTYENKKQKQIMLSARENVSDKHSLHIFTLERNDK